VAEVLLLVSTRRIIYCVYINISAVKPHNLILASVVDTIETALESHEFGAKTRRISKNPPKFQEFRAIGEHFCHYLLQANHHMDKLDKLLHYTAFLTLQTPIKIL
jgi:hypothetical protein